MAEDAKGRPEDAGEAGDPIHAGDPIPARDPGPAGDPGQAGGRGPAPGGRGAGHPADRFVALAAVELSRYSETTRRALYDVVVEVFFTPTPEEVAAAAADPENHYVPTYTAEEAGLRVDYVAGRWFAVWKALEAGPELAADQRYRMVRIDVGGASPAGAPAFRDA